MTIPRRSHPTASLLKLNKARADAMGTSVVAADAGGQAALLKKALKHEKSVIFSGRRERFTSKQKTAGLNR